MLMVPRFRSLSEQLSFLIHNQVWQEEQESVTHRALLCLTAQGQITTTGYRVLADFLIAQMYFYKFY